MVKSKVGNLGDFVNLPNPGLRAYFRHTVEGNPSIYRPPFWSKGKPQDILSRWLKVIESHGIKNKYPRLYEFELEMKGKVGPLSYQAPLRDRLSSIESYWTLAAQQGDPLDPRAVKAVAAKFSQGERLSLRSVDETVRNMRLSTNSGAPYFTKRSAVVKKTVPMHIDNGKQHLPNGSYELAAILGWRGQEGGPFPKDTKQRVVWMMPFALNIAELQWYQVAIEHIQKHNLIPAYVSLESVDKSVTTLFDIKSEEDQIICTDFSSFDQHFNGVCQQASLEIQAAMMSDDENSRRWQSDIYPLKYNIPLLCSEEVMFKGPHGMGSGSGGTNFDESVLHSALQEEAALLANTVLYQGSQCLGDDGLLCAPGLRVEDVMRSYTRHGLEMNPDKQYVSTQDCVYLRRLHMNDYRVRGTAVGVYSTFRALGRLLYQERYYDPTVWNEKMVTLRAWAIIENCHFHPCFEEFVDFCITGDKYRLGLDIPGFIEGVGKLARESTAQIQDFLGYTNTLGNDAPDGGITKWRIYKYLKSKA